MLKSETINFNSVHTHCQFGTIAALSDLSIYIHQSWSRDMAVGNNSPRTPFSLIYTNSCVCIIRNSGRHNPQEAIFSHLLIDSDLYWRGYLEMPYFCGRPHHDYRAWPDVFLITPDLPTEIDILLNLLTIW